MGGAVPVGSHFLPKYPPGPRAASDMESAMKKKVGKGAAIAIIAVAVAVIGWLGWYFSENPYNRGLNEEAIFRAAEAKAKSNGIDLRTAPGAWPGLYYKYHPEEKPPSGKTAPAAPAPAGLPIGAPGASASSEPAPK